MAGVGTSLGEGMAQLWLVPPSGLVSSRVGSPPPPDLAGTASGLPPPGSLPECPVRIKALPGLGKSAPFGSLWGLCSCLSLSFYTVISPSLHLPESCLKSDPRSGCCPAGQTGQTARPGLRGRQVSLRVPLQLLLPPRPNTDPEPQPENMAARLRRVPGPATASAS